MKRKMVWLLLSSLMAVALVLSSCQATPAEEEAEGETITGRVVEKEAPKAEEEEEVEEVVEEAGPEMVRDAKGRLVEKPQYGGTVSIRVGGNPTTNWDPWWTQQGGAGYNALAAVYERLTGQDWSIGPDVRPPGLWYIPPEAVKGYSAESWENPDPLTYIVHLRQGQRFWNKFPVNGREVTAEDWKYSIERIMGLGEWAEQGRSPYVGYTAWEVVDSVEVLDKYTFAMHLNKPSALFPEFWGAEIGPWLHPREVVDEYGAEFGWEEVVGSGPWMLEDLILDSSITYKKFPDYYGIDDNFPENHIPYADYLKILIIPDWSTTLAAFRTGKIDHLIVGWEDFDALQETNPELQWAPDVGIAYGAAVNVSIEPYSDIRVRKAMQMAINLPEIAETYYGGTADPYPFMCNKAFVNYYTPLEELPEDCAEAFRYDPERARELLAEAGYPNGFKQEWPMTGPSDLADLMIAYWEQIGIETEIRIMEVAAYNSFVYGATGERQLAWWWLGTADWHPLQILSYVAHGQETHFWNLADADDPVINAAFDNIQTEFDPAERDRMYKEAFLYGTCQFWQISSPGQVFFTVYQPWFKGYWGQQAIIAIGWAPVWARVWIDQDLKYQLTGERE